MTRRHNVGNRTGRFIPAPRTAHGTTAIAAARENVFGPWTDAFAGFIQSRKGLGIHFACGMDVPRRRQR